MPWSAKPSRPSPRPATGAQEDTTQFGKIVGNSARMQHIYQMVRQVAKTRTNILITGESGTGKELIAKAIHENSDRAENPFVPVNCGGIPETLMESEFFGHKKGAFTGATQDKMGLLEVAHGGTIFLDEVGELSIPMQVKLLRAVQERVVRAVGGTKDVAVDIRIISATNKHLEDEVIAGRFREDLFYRLNVIEIKVPPLRERKGDLKILAQHFLEKYSREMGKEVTKISSYAIDLLKSTISPAMCANWKTSSNAPWPSPTPTSCCPTAWPCPSTSAAGSKASRTSASTSTKCPTACPWTTSWPKSNAPTSTRPWSAPAATRTKPPTCWASPSARSAIGWTSWGSKPIPRRREGACLTIFGRNLSIWGRRWGRIDRQRPKK